MYFIKKKRNKPLYKKFLSLKKNIQNNNKLMNFKRVKWQKFQYLLLKSKRKKFYDPISYFLSNFKNFYNKKFKNNLQNKQRLNLFYGGLGKKYLKGIVKQVLNSTNLSTHPAILVIEKMETRLDTALYRTYFANSFNNAQQLVSYKKVYVNNQIIQHSSYQLKKGDLITFDKSIFNILISNILNSNIWFMPSKHFQINYKTLEILVIEDIKYTNSMSNYPFWIDFNSFIKFYEK